MTYPWGLAPRPDGTGTTPAEVQRITAAEYPTPGILSGCEVQLKADMTYGVLPGAVVMSVGDRLSYKIAVLAASVSTTTAPASGSRVDTLYVDPTDWAVHVAAGTTPPAGAVTIGVVDVPAGIKATSAASLRADRFYTRAVFSPQGPLALWTEPAGQGVAAQAGNILLWAGRVPKTMTDRYIEVELTQCLYASQDGGGTPGGTGSMRYTCTIGTNTVSFEMRYDRIWAPEQFRYRQWILAGDAPEVRINRVHAWGDPAYHFGGAGYVPGGVCVSDLGGAQ